MGMVSMDKIEYKAHRNNVREQRRNVGDVLTFLEAGDADLGLQEGNLCVVHRLDELTDEGSDRSICCFVVLNQFLCNKSTVSE